MSSYTSLSRTGESSIGRDCQIVIGALGVAIDFIVDGLETRSVS